MINTNSVLAGRKNCLYPHHALIVCSTSHFQVAFCLCQNESSRETIHIKSLFCLQVLFSCANPAQFCRKTCFESEAQRNSEMAYNEDSCNTQEERIVEQYTKAQITHGQEERRPRDHLSTSNRVRSGPKMSGAAE